MVLNFQLAREIYGMVPWCVDQYTLPVLTNVLSDAKISNQVSFEVKNNTPILVPCSEAISEIRYATRTWHLNNDDKSSYIGLISIDGPITNSGGASSYGMLELSSMMLSMSKDERVKGFIILGNSGGGSSIAVETMTDAIDEVRKTKPVHGLIPKGAMAASAMYMILASCETVSAVSEMSIVGSHGTMMQFDGRKANTEDSDGVKHIRVYATASVKKNDKFESALNEDNYELIVNELLNPFAERSRERTLAYRPMLAGSGFDDGRDLFAKDAVGTFIDGFSSISELTQKILSSKSINQNNNPKSKTMTVDELKSQHPETYKSIFSSGVKHEQERSKSWLAHIDSDQKAVVDGIKSGEEISSSAREELLIKASTKGIKSRIENDSPDDVTDPPAGDNRPEDELAFYSTL